MEEVVGEVVGAVGLFKGRGAQPEKFVELVGFNGIGSGAGRGTLRPMAVNGGPLSPKANGFSFGSSDGVLDLLVIIAHLGIEDS